MLNETETPKTAIDKRGDINTVTLIPNDSTRLNSNKLEPRSPKRPSIPDWTSTTPTTTHYSYHFTPHSTDCGTKYNATHNIRQVTIDPSTLATPSNLKISQQQLTPNNKDNLVYDVYYKKKRHELLVSAQPNINPQFTLSGSQSPWQAPQHKKWNPNLFFVVPSLLAWFAAPLWGFFGWQDVCTCHVVLFWEVKLDILLYYMQCLVVPKKNYRKQSLQFLVQY